MKCLLRFFVLTAFAIVLSTLVSIAVRRWWAFMPFAEFEAECGLTSGAIVQGRTYYDFAEDRSNPARLQEIREKAGVSWKGDLFLQRVVTSCLTTSITHPIDTNELMQILSTVSVEVAPRNPSVIVRMRGRDAAAVARLAEVYASEIERTVRESEQERLGRVVEQLSRNLKCQTAVVVKIENRMKDLEGLSTAVGSNENARLGAELSKARTIQESMAEQLSSARMSISRGEMGSFVRMTRKAGEPKLAVPDFWSIWWCAFPVVIVLVLIIGTETYS